MVKGVDLDTLMAGWRITFKYRLPDKDFGLRYRSSMYDLYDFLALPCQNHYLEVYRAANHQKRQ